MPIRLLESISAGVRGYPYRDRLPYAAVAGCLFAWVLRRGGIAPVDWICVAAFTLSLLCRDRGRAHWFLLGIVVGATLAELANFSSFHAH